jgi:uncharacterized protein
LRVLLDANVLVSALLSRVGAPALLLQAWLDARLELIVCPSLVAEVERTLARPKLAGRLAPEDRERFVRLLSELAEFVPDPEGPSPVRSTDPEDDYLLALAARERVPLVSGDAHLLALREDAPVFSPRAFLDELGGSE